MLRSAILVILVAIFAIVLRHSIQGGFQQKDGTAMGVAKIRHYEALHEEPSKRLYYDPYAQYMYPGSFIQTLLGENKTRRLYDFVFKGVLEVLTTRTKWLDEEIHKAIRYNNAQQMVILGAGYDTRGFRLDLPDDFIVIEVDQPDVQALKKQKLQKIAMKDKQVASRMNTENQTNGGIVRFLAVDFNQDDIGEKLLEMNLLRLAKETIIVLEGVTQYIPKSSTATTLAQLRKILPSQSVLLVSYVPQDIFENPIKCGPKNNIKKLLKGAEGTGEPWISGWTKDGFKFFLGELGYEVLSDTTISDLNELYLKPLNRHLDESDVLSVERYVVAVTKNSI